MLRLRCASRLPRRRRRVHWAAREGYNAETVASYDRGRPSYSASAVDLAMHVAGIARDGLRVVEIGAGTGKFTAALLEGARRAGTGVEVVAVEPVGEMRRALARNVPGCRAVFGTAEDLSGLEAASFDAVLCAQAFHWFANAAALAEAARVLRPGGALCLLWNTRDDRVPWVRALETDVVDPLYPPNVPRQQSGAWQAAFEAAGCPFSPLESAHLRSAHVAPDDAVVDRVLSLSVAGVLPGGEKRLLADRVRALLARPDVGRDPSSGHVVLPYRTDIYWSRLRSGAAAPGAAAL